MSDSDRVQVSYIEEVNWGVTPSGDLQRVRLTGEGLKQATQMIESNELDPNRMVNDLIRTNINAEGPVNIELSYGAHDDLIAAAVQATDWSTAVTVSASTISFAASSGGTQVISDSGSGFGSITVGSWVKVTDPDNTENTGIFKVTAAAAGAITVQNASGVLQTAGSTVSVVQGAQVVNGVTERSFSFEKYFTDVSEYMSYVGMEVDQFTLNVQVQQIITGGFTFLGKSEADPGSTIGTGYTAASTNSVLNSVNDVDGVVEGGTTLGVTQFGFTLTNNLRQRPQVGTLGPISLGQGRLGITGNLTAYFTDQTLVGRYRNFTDTSLAIVAQDVAGNAYVFEFPSVNYSDATVVAQGNNQDVMASLQFTAKKNASESVQVRVVRFAA